MSGVASGLNAAIVDTIARLSGRLRPYPFNEINQIGSNEGTPA